MDCPACGGDNRPGSRFCRHCGAEMGEVLPAAVAAEVAPAPAAVEAEATPEGGEPAVEEAPAEPEAAEAAGEPESAPAAEVEAGSLPPASLSLLKRRRRLLRVRSLPSRRKRRPRRWPPWRPAPSSPGDICWPSCSTPSPARFVTWPTTCSAAGSAALRATAPATVSAPAVVRPSTGARTCICSRSAAQTRRRQAVSRWWSDWPTRASSSFCWPCPRPSRTPRRPWRRCALR